MEGTATERAVGWAMRQPIRSPEARLVLMTLGWHADAQGVVSLTLKELMERTSLSRMAVLAAMVSLQRERYLEFTRREGVVVLPPGAMAVLH